MSNIIDFPRRSDFADTFRGSIPEPILSDLCSAYDRVKRIHDEYPSVTLSVRESDRPGIEDLIEQHKSYTLRLLTRILELETELVLAKAGKSAS